MALKVNGQIVQLAQPDADIIIEIDNSDGRTVNAQLRLTDVTETDPAGRFRIQVDGDALQVQGAYQADWATAQSLLTFSRDGVTGIRFTEAGLQNLLEQLRLFLGAGSGVGIHLHQLITDTLRLGI